MPDGPAPESAASFGRMDLQPIKPDAGSQRPDLTPARGPQPLDKNPDTRAKQLLQVAQNPTDAQVTAIARRILTENPTTDPREIAAAKGKAQQKLADFRGLATSVAQRAEQQVGQTRREALAGKGESYGEKRTAYDESKLGREATRVAFQAQADWLASTGIQVEPGQRPLTGSEAASKRNAELGYEAARKVAQAQEAVAGKVSAGQERLSASAESGRASLKSAVETGRKGIAAVVSTGQESWSGLVQASKDATRDAGRAAGAVGSGALGMGRGAGEAAATVGRGAEVTGRGIAAVGRYLGGEIGGAAKDLSLDAAKDAAPNLGQGVVDKAKAVGGGVAAMGRGVGEAAGWTARGAGKVGSYLGAEIGGAAKMMGADAAKVVGWPAVQVWRGGSWAADKAGSAIGGGAWCRW